MLAYLYDLLQKRNLVLTRPMFWLIFPKIFIFLVPCGRPAQPHVSFFADYKNILHRTVNCYIVLY